MNFEQLQTLVSVGESLTLEFKGEEHDPFSDRDIYETIVCMANTDGGTLLIGIEDDLRITGAKPRHGSSTDPTRLQAAIFNNTEPRINTRISIVTIPDGHVIAIEVDRYPEVCATKAGMCLRRIMGARGPECIPFYPHEHIGRRSTLGLLDFSAQPCGEATQADLNPLEFERLRQTIQRLHGDPILLELSDLELAKALQLLETTPQGLVPNIAGVLLLGHEETLRRFVPTHEAAFQVLDIRGDVRVNDFFHKPLLATIEEIQQRFDARIEEEEIVIGMFRLPIPEYGRIAFREAILNALLHRDYSQLGTVYVQWHHDHLLLTSPGGLLDGITLQNILVHEPKSRNARLYEAAKRIGLVEKTGRGVDKIYYDRLRCGRPAPSYERSDTSGVRIVLSGGKANIAFAQFVYEQDKAGQPLTLDELLVLNHLITEQHLALDQITSLIQKSDAEGQAVVEQLIERSFVEEHEKTRQHQYQLSTDLDERFSMKAEAAQPKALVSAQYERMVLDYVGQHGRINRAETADLCKISSFQASRLLRRISEKNERFQMLGTRRGAHYILQEAEL